jgi:polar amino acid transport system substrate-binding protein
LGISPMYIYLSQRKPIKMSLFLRSNLVILAALTALYLTSAQATAEDGNTLILATVPSSGQRISTVEGLLPAEHPGWFVELTRQAAKQCGSEIDYLFMPWTRALKMVEAGKVSAVFNSSYKLDRAEYGAYPMLNGKPDTTRASKRYVYRAYVSRDAPIDFLNDLTQFAGRKIVAERSASILPLLKEHGADIYETANIITMLRMAAGKRMDATVGIEDSLDAALERHPDLKAMLRKVDMPVKSSIGYVMFSKIFYASHKELVECFWDTSAALQNTDWFKEMRATYK